MRLNELRKLVNETVRQEQRKSRTRKPKNFSSLVENTVRKVLREAEEGEEEGQDQGGSIPNIGHETNTGDEAAVNGLIDLLFDNPEGLKSLYGGLPATGKDDDGKDKFAWYAKKIGGLDVSEIESIRDAALGSKEEALKGIARVNKKLKAGKGFSKAYMPAFEGVDVKIVADALDASQGELGVDFEKPWNKTHDFKKYMEDPEVKEKLAENTLRRWGKLAGLLNEQGGFKATEDMPFPGPAKTMPGAPAVGNNPDTTPSSDQVSGVAKGYLTKGNEEMGADGSDVMTVDANTNIGHNSMVPTQREVKLLKTLAFALFDVGQEMGGAFVDNEGNILDGHHRWSGQELRGYTGQHSQVHMINRAGKFAGKGSTPRFLKLLSTISAAIGRPTKMK